MARYCPLNECSNLSSRTSALVYSYEIEGLPVQTGDIICTSDGNSQLMPSLLWRAFGALVPGAIDHVAIYAGSGADSAQGPDHSLRKARIASAAQNTIQAVRAMPASASLNGSIIGS